MTVYVDDSEKGYKDMILSRMFASSLEELQEMGDKIFPVYGKAELHFHPVNGVPFYYVSKSMKKRAIDKGAVFVSVEEMNILFDEFAKEKGKRELTRAELILMCERIIKHASKLNKEIIKKKLNKATHLFEGYYKNKTATTRMINETELMLKRFKEYVSHEEMLNAIEGLDQLSDYMENGLYLASEEYRSSEESFYISEEEYFSY